MAVKCNYQQVKIQTQEIADKLHKQILNSFIQAGEEFVTQARNQVQSHEQGTYLNQTTNLRNSVGYYIFHNGERVFKKEGDVSPSDECVTKILELVDPDGYQLIGFAGMNYASYVEDLGYNVITAQADTCIANLTGFLERLKVIEKGYNEQLQEDVASVKGDYYDAGL